MNKLCILWIGSLLLLAVQCADKNAWKSRTIYQVLTDRFWRSNGDTRTGCDLSTNCGGDFAGIVQKLQYIKDLGFDAIWISPVVDNLENGYHGYWFRNWEKINSHFGDEASLKRLVDMAHTMDIWVMVDVVANHVAPIEQDYSQIYPFNRPEHYHPECPISDWNNQWQVEHCRLADLPDLDQQNPFVRQYLKDWIQKLVQKFNFDGIRIDTIPHVEKPFWSEYTEEAGVFSIGEIFNGNDPYVADYQNYIDATLNYGMYFTIREVFGNSSSSMRNVGWRIASQQNLFKDVDALGIFVDNHDNPRFLNGNSDWRLFKSALAFALTSRGIPIFYYGSEQAFAGGADPHNREPMWNNFNYDHEIFKFIQAINNARKASKSNTQPQQEKWVDDNLYCFKRGNMIVAVTNKVYDLSVYVPNIGFSEGTILCNIFWGNDCVKVTGGKILVDLEDGEVKVFLPKKNSYFKNAKLRRRPRREVTTMSS